MPLVISKVCICLKANWYTSFHFPEKKNLNLSAWYLVANKWSTALLEYQTVADPNWNKAASLTWLWEYLEFDASQISHQ